MIKNKIHFAVGMFCVMCLVIGFVNHTDKPILLVTAIATVVNIIIGLRG